MSIPGTVNLVELCAVDDLWIGEMEAFDVGPHEA